MILVPIGTKAQLVKMAPVMLELEKRNIPFHFVLTGQHAETMEELIISFKLRQPDYCLAPIKEANTKRKLLNWLFIIAKNNFFNTSPLKKYNYNLCLVHGDTLSTLVMALLAKKHKIKVGHVEAGLRSYNLFNPFPEEAIRIAVSRISDIFYCAGSWSLQNLSKMKSPKREFIDILENTLLDSVRLALSKSQDTTHEKFGIVSIHRYENLSNKRRLDFIFQQILEAQKVIPLKFVLHPATRKKLDDLRWGKILKTSGIELLPRMNYIDFINMLNKSSFLITDGGSNQEECSYIKLPCLLMRKATERKEGLGELIVLSNYDKEITSRFIEGNIDAKRAPISPENLDKTVSPSAKIADHITSLLDNLKKN